MTKAQALKRFRELYPTESFRYTGTGGRGRVDTIARSEAWNNYTDSQCKEGLITLKQYETWANPW